MYFNRRFLLLFGICLLSAIAEPLLILGTAANSGQIAFVSVRDGNPDIYVMDADGKHRRRVTTHAAEDGHPSWSPDGRKIAFVSNRNAGYIQIWVIDADGKNPIRLTDGVWDQNPVWSPNGKKIAYQAYRKKALNVDFEDRNYEVYVMDADGSNKNRLTDRQEFDGHPSWSPDSKKIVYSSRRENRIAEIYVMDAMRSAYRKISKIGKINSCRRGRRTGGASHLSTIPKST